MWSIARRFMRNSADAEDVIQEIFLQVWQSAARFDESKGSEAVFITMIARRRFIDRLRKAKTEPVFDSSSEVFESMEWSDPTASPQVSAEAEQALRALSGIRSEHRQVLELGLLHGLTQMEIASRLGLPLGTVKSFMRRGLIQVRECMHVDLRDRKIHEHVWSYPMHDPPTPRPSIC
jgi:RNA polymerase sigma factor (sigma-70 family)